MKAYYLSLLLILFWLGLDPPQGLFLMVDGSYSFISCEEKEHGCVFNNGGLLSARRAVRLVRRRGV